MIKFVLVELRMHPRVEVMYVNLYTVDRRSCRTRIVIYYFGLCLSVCADSLTYPIVVNYKFGYQGDDEARANWFYVGINKDAENY